MLLPVFVLLGSCTLVGVTDNVFHPSVSVGQGPSSTLSQTGIVALGSCNQDLLLIAKCVTELVFRSCSGACLFSVSDLSRIDWKIKSDLWTFSAIVHAQRTSLYFFGHKSTRSRKACLITIQLLISGVESNPGPGNQHVNMGLINARSIVNKTALIHDAITNHDLDLLAITGTFVYEDSPDVFKRDAAPEGYSIIHEPRQQIQMPGARTPRGGGIVIIHHDSIEMKVQKVDPTRHKSFELLLVKLPRSKNRLKVAIIYC